MGQFVLRLVARSPAREGDSMTQLGFMLATGVVYLLKRRAGK